MKKCNNLNISLDRIKTYGRYYGVKVDFNYNESLRFIYNSNQTVPATSRDGELIENTKLTNAVFQYLKENSDYNNLDQVFVIINTNKEGQSVAAPSKSGLYTYIYYDIDAQYVYAHELLHLFGSSDIYKMPDKIRKYYNFDITNSENNIGSEYGPLSAFLSKWLLYLDIINLGGRKQ